MAIPGYVYFNPTLDRVLDATTHGYRWVLGPDRVIDWSVSGGLEGEFWFNPGAVAAEISNILSTFSYVANIKFNYVGSYSTPYAASAAGAEINVAVGTLADSRYWALAFFDPLHIGYSGQVGDVFLNINSPANALPNYLPGTAGWALFIHELGHVLGLKHPHDDGGTGRPLLGQIGLASFDRDWGTIMSYRDDFNWNLRAWNPATPMLLDVLALQYLYGPNLTVNAGDTTHQLFRSGLYGTLWDPSGTDTVSAAGASEGWHIELPDYQLSSLVPTLGGLATPVLDLSIVAPTTLFWLAGTMENAVGSAFADQIIGSSGNNRITGGGGNDLIDGGSGIDTAVFSGAPGQYVFQRNADTVTLSGPDGFDTLANVERLLIGSDKFAIDIDGHGGQAYRLYQAAFNRAPDPGGLGYQMNALDIGLSLSQVAGNFIASPEFQRTYGALNDTQFVTQLYANVLHRAPDAGGLTYHVTHLSQGFARADILVGFSESPENQAALIGVISNGMFYT